MQAGAVSVKVNAGVSPQVLLPGKPPNVVVSTVRERSGVALLKARRGRRRSGLKNMMAYNGLNLGAGEGCEDRCGGEELGQDDR